MLQAVVKTFLFFRGTYGNIAWTASTVYSRYFIVCEWYGSHMSCGQWCEQRGVEMDETKPLQCIVSPVQEEKRGKACIYASVYLICFCASLPPLPLQQRDISFDAFYIQLRAGRSGFNSRQWAVYFSLIQNFQTDSGSYPPPCLVGSGACFPKDKRSECIADYSHPSSAHV